jgi:hypothetical protein
LTVGGVAVVEATIDPEGPGAEKELAPTGAEGDIKSGVPEAGMGLK